MPLEIITRKVKEQHHYHKCPTCKQVKLEPNTVCKMSAGDHVFRCIGCLSGFWRRFGDAFMDTYLNEDQFECLMQLAPDETSATLDQRDKLRAEKEIAEAVAKALSAPPPEQHVITPDEIKAEQLKQEQLRDEATVVKYEEVRDEIEEMNKEEKFT